MENQDYQREYNGWLQIYKKLSLRFQRLLRIANNGLSKLDYDEQEDMVWMSKILKK